MMLHLLLSAFTSSLPALRAVTMHSLQNLCRHSTVVMVTVSRSRHIGHLSSGYRDWKEGKVHIIKFFIVIK